ncbi:antitoxin HipB [Pelotomaculum sp. FP]|uniref:helix-turn-helix domain-containing protein n=1 Tax=Pelotomaculum sp. FP TaxID=261474 RepID=UPI001066742A|nr:helix-turn-helix transcriptional regulator [Pelotomaculum sp. FP]TEB10837.1 antitoxin HipB [Pelotomaculum sp. FP]
MKFFNMNDLTTELEKKRPDIIEEIIKNEPNYFLVRDIIKTRIKKGLTQAELAKKSNLTQNQISRIESAQLGSINTITKVLNALDLRLTITEKDRPKLCRYSIKTVLPRKARQKQSGEKEQKSMQKIGI